LYLLCVLNEDGKVVRETKVRGGWQDLIKELKTLKEPFAICFEASCGAGHLHDQLCRVARRVVVAHPGQLRLIFKAKRKNDRVDARKLATLLFLDQLPAVHMPSMDVRGWRSLIEHRHRQVAKRTRAKNGIRSLLRGYGIAAPSRSRLWTRKGLAWLRELALPLEMAALQRDILLEEVEHLDAQVKRVEKELNRIGDGNPGVILLRTIPGVGARTAEAMVAYVDDPYRFGRNKTIGSYLGLVPCQDESAGKARFGHITREGPSTVRKMLTEACWKAIGGSPRIRAQFEQVCRGDRNRKKIALIATAHYLARVMLAMLKTGEVWCEGDLARAA
jgi:transposase